MPDLSVNRLRLHSACLHQKVRTAQEIATPYKATCKSIARLFVESTRHVKDTGRYKVSIGFPQGFYFLYDTIGVSIVLAYLCR